MNRKQKNLKRWKFKNITWPSSKDSSRKAMMIKIAAKPPDTNEINFAMIEIIGEGNCFRYSEACITLLFTRCLNKWSTCNTKISVYVKIQHYSMLKQENKKCKISISRNNCFHLIFTSGSKQLLFFMINLNFHRQHNYITSNNWLTLKITR